MKQRLTSPRLPSKRYPCRKRMIPKPPQSAHRLSRENRRSGRRRSVRPNDSILQTTEQRRRGREDASAAEGLRFEMLQKKQHLEIELKQVIQQRSEDNARHKQSLEEAAKTIQTKQGDREGSKLSSRRRPSAAGNMKMNWLR